MIAPSVVDSNFHSLCPKVRSSVTFDVLSLGTFGRGGRYLKLEHCRFCPSIIAVLTA